MSSDPRNGTRIPRATTASITTPAATPAVTTPEHAPRLRMKPAPSAGVGTGHVDGAWWPRSRDLSTELPALFAALAARLGVAHRVSYNLAEWDNAARRVSAGGHSVRLAGFRYQGASTVDVIGFTGRRLTLLVIPPETATATARTISAAAADETNTDSVDALLAHPARDGSIPRQRANPDDADQPPA